MGVIELSLLYQSSFTSMRIEITKRNTKFYVVYLTGGYSKKTVTVIAGNGCAIISI